MSEVADLKGAIQEVCRRYSVVALSVFGSAARGDFDPTSSDFDFAVRFRQLSAKEYTNCYFGLLFSLQDLLGRKVDLVDLEIQSNPVLLRSIADDEQALYAA